MTKFNEQIEKFNNLEGISISGKKFLMSLEDKEKEEDSISRIKSLLSKIKQIAVDKAQTEETDGESTLALISHRKLITNIVNKCVDVDFLKESKNF